MQARPLGQSNVKISPILMGTWQAGKAMWTGIEDVETIKAIRAGFEAGITTIDTAEIYGEGHSEQIVAQAIADVRDQVQLASKVFPTHLHYDEVITACERSLKNLQTDYLDLYQIHWPSGSFDTEIVPIEETMEALKALKQEGKIRAVGVSNFSQAQLVEAQQYGQIDSVQPPYSLFWRQAEKELIPYCVEQNITVLAYSSLAQGLLTGKFGADHQFESGDHRAKNKLFQGENYQRALTALDQLRPIAEKKGCTLAQLALAWLIAQPNTCAIAGARNAQQALANAQTLTVELSDAEIAEIDQIGRGVTDYLDDNPVLWTFKV